jgi:hypothetical protein
MIVFNKLHTLPQSPENKLFRDTHFYVDVQIVAIRPLVCGKTGETIRGREIIRRRGEANDVSR